MSSGKIIQLHGKSDPWAGLRIPYPKDDAEAVQLYEYATLTLLNSLMIAVPTDQTRDILRKITVAYLEAWHPEIKAPPL